MVTLNKSLTVSVNIVQLIIYILKRRPDLYPVKMKSGQLLKRCPCQSNFRIRAFALSTALVSRVER